MFLADIFLCTLHQTEVVCNCEELEGCVHISMGRLLHKYRIFLVAALPLFRLQVLAKVQEAFVSLLALVSTQQKAAASLGMHPAGTSSDTPGSSSSSSSSSSKGGAPPQALQTAAAAAAGAMETAAAAAAGGTLLESEALLLRTAQCVLSIAPSRKGRYQPLTALLPYLGASVLLKLQPGLVAETIEAMQSNLCASAAAGFFKALLLQLRTELSTDSTPVLQQQQQGAVNSVDRTADATTAPAAVSAGDADLLAFVPASMRAWCRFWLPDLLSALWAQGERARTYVANYALPMVLQAEPTLLQPMVDTILAAHAADIDAAAGAGAGSTSASSTPGGSSGAAGVRDAAAALVVVLRTGRRLQLVGDLDVLLPQGSGSGGGGVDEASVAMSPAGLLLSAASSVTASLRIEALELVCISAR